MHVGGVQKALYNLLWTIHNQYRVTLLLFSMNGEYADRLPPDVRVIACKSLFRYLGVSQGECNGLNKLKRGGLVAGCRAFGRSAVLKLLLASQKTLEEHYDCAIAYLHNGRPGNFYGGVQEFVLHRIPADKKAAFLHCDYRSCGADQEDNNKVIAHFDRIAACSEGCRRAFEQVLPELREKTVTVRNCHRFDEIRDLAEKDPVCYDPARKNVIMVSRLAHEKGIHRGIDAAAKAMEQGIPVTLHIVGGGPMLEHLRSHVREKNLEKHVCFYGQQENPYRFMKNADLFLLTSYHEAAPMVIEEARCLNLPVLTVETTSSAEMVIGEGCGWVCDNTQEAIDRALIQVLSDDLAMDTVKNRMRTQSADNTVAVRQFAELIEE